MGKFDGFTCKDCVNFIRDGESRSGTCKVRKYLRDKNSRRITNIPLRCTFAKPACLCFAKRTDELKDSEPPKTYAELLAENIALRSAMQYLIADGGADCCAKCIYGMGQTDAICERTHNDCLEGMKEFFKDNG